MARSPKKTPTVLGDASRQWATRPDDQRFLSGPAMLEQMDAWTAMSRQGIVKLPDLKARQIHGEDDIEILGPEDEHGTRPTNWSFGQLCQRIQAPQPYLSSISTKLAVDNINWGLQNKADHSEAQALVRYSETPGHDQLMALTGQNYGRIWSRDLIAAAIAKYGNFVDGDWRIPGEFGKKVTPTKANTTLYASDRDMFIFLADEVNRIEIPGKTAGMHKNFARGFFLFNSEVGDGTIGAAFFLFDYACSNRNVWGVGEFTSVKLRHTSGAPARWLGEIEPILLAYSKAKVTPWVTGIKAAMAKKLEDPRKFLTIDMKLGPKIVEQVLATHIKEEQRPIETLWDASCGVTAFAKSISHTNNRLKLERVGGEILAKAA